MVSYVLLFSSNPNFRLHFFSELQKMQFPLRPLQGVCNCIVDKEKFCKLELREFGGFVELHIIAQGQEALEMHLADYVGDNTLKEKILFRIIGNVMGRVKPYKLPYSETFSPYFGIRIKLMGKRDERDDIKDVGLWGTCNLCGLPLENWT